MSVEYRELELKTAIPFDLTVPKPFLYAYTDLNKNIYRRVFRVDGQLFICKVEQIKKLNKTLKFYIESNDTITAKAVSVLTEKIRYELGLDETMSTLIKRGREHYKYRQLLGLYPGFRLFANSEIHEAAILTILSQNTSFPDYMRITNLFYRRFGELVPWKQNMYAFPTLERLSNIAMREWKSINVHMQAKPLAAMTMDTLEDIETYTYYPIFERGLKGLHAIKGIASYTARVLMVYAARRYNKAIYNKNSEMILKKEFNVSFRSIFSFDRWIEKNFPEEPALVMHPYLLKYLDSYTNELDYDTVEDFVEQY